MKTIIWWNLCWETEIAGYPIKLEQNGLEFRVTYGKQVTVCDYGDALKELAESIAHALACEGLLTFPEDELEEAKGAE